MLVMPHGSLLTGVGVGQGELSPRVRGILRDLGHLNEETFVLTSDIDITGPILCTLLLYMGRISVYYIAIIILL